LQNIFAFSNAEILGADARATMEINCVRVDSLRNTNAKRGVVPIHLASSGDVELGFDQLMEGSEVFARGDGFHGIQENGLRTRGGCRKQIPLVRVFLAVAAVRVRRHSNGGLERFIAVGAEFVARARGLAGEEMGDDLRKRVPFRNG